jgi:hypothetical protein
MFRFDGDVFLFGTAMAEKLLQNLDAKSPVRGAFAGRTLPSPGGGQNERRNK